jgi:iron complex transport system ATP-binding protein
LPNKNVVISLSSVSYKRSSYLILKNINWEVGQGERWLILGVNGSGKTTLLNILAGYIWPTKGSIKVLGYEFGKIDLRKIRENIGYVSSDLIEFIPRNDKLIDVILSGKFASFGLYNEPTAQDLKFADDIINFIDINKIKNLEFHKLSRGEKQRALIGRALMCNPSLMLLDEPYEGLDLPSRERILNLIEKLSNKRSDIILILTTHHIEEIPESFEKILLLKNGEIFQKGETRNILTEDIICKLFDFNLRIKKVENRFFAFSTKR